MVGVHGSNVEPEKRRELVERFAASPQLDNLYKDELAKMAHQNEPEGSPDGYFAFYELIHGFPPPKHVRTWIYDIFDAHREGKGYTLLGFRGSWKSVSLSVTFVAWRIGLEPRKTNVLMSAEEGKALNWTTSIAQYIETHPEWKRVFPNIVPITGKWGTNGYWVRDTEKSEAEWEQLQAGVVDPTFVGGGYQSRAINGKHPTGCLVVDDSHHLNNSSSERSARRSLSP